ncbi:MAG: hypothetical protein E7319_07135 [Clostridiales bacterium]|nr:hypothetical protein [Clostridiales bacterium]
MILLYGNPLQDARYNFLFSAEHPDVFMDKMILFSTDASLLPEKFTVPASRALFFEKAFSQQKTPHAFCVRRKVSLIDY